MTKRFIAMIAALSRMAGKAWAKQPETSGARMPGLIAGSGHIGADRLLSERPDGRWSETR